MSRDQFMAGLPELQAWAAAEMAARSPDYVIGDNYLRRWWIVPRNPLRNVYLHQFTRSDDDRALHDHPWTNMSLVISGRYIEHTPEGSFLREPGDTVSRAAESLHRIELPEGEVPVTLFITGPVIRDWGFQCPNGWVHWRKFTDETGAGIGRGCGE